MEFAIEIALSGVAALFAWRLSRKARFNNQLSVWLWASAFAGIGAGALLSVFCHRFGFLLPGFSTDIVWRLSMALLGLANALLLSGVVLAYTTGRIRFIFFAGIGVKFAIFLVSLGYYPSFNLVVYDTALTTLPLLAFCTYGAWTWKHPYAQWIVSGALLWLFGTLLHQGRVVPGNLLSPDDVYRCIEILVLFLLLRGGWSMRDEPSSPTSLSVRTIG
jgi:hypothetical protein